LSNACFTSLLLLLPSSSSNYQIAAAAAAAAAALYCLLLPIARCYHQMLAPVRWQFLALVTAEVSPAR
jgi:hypothetical protein